MKSAQVGDGGDGAYRATAGVADPAIKLFGSSIPRANFEASDPTSSILLNSCCGQGCQSAHSNEAETKMEFSSNVLVTSSGSNDSNPVSNLKAVGGIIQDIVRSRPPCQENINTRLESTQNHVVSEKAAKKPDKLIPCPRCESLDTKFCYFNNYNVNQPRHFCRKCQRYWTAGGTLRNVPVGAGRRKNKHLTSHQKHAACTDMTRVRCDTGDMAGQRCTSAHFIVGATPSIGKQPVLQVPSLDTSCTSSVDSPTYSPVTQGSMASFGQESPLCKSTAATTIDMQRYTPAYNNEVVNGETNTTVGVMKLELEESFSLENTVHASSRASNVGAVSFQVSTMDKSVNEPLLSTCASDMAAQQMDHEAKVRSDNPMTLSNCSDYNGLWQLGNMTTWKIPTNGVDPEGGAVSLLPPGLLPNGAPPVSLWASPPWPFISPPAMWGTPPLAMPWEPAVAATATAMMQNSGLGITMMRKHQLDGSPPNGCLWVPKTLRIDDPLDASRSSIWATLGLGDGPASSPPGRAAAKAFQAKSETKDTGNSFRHTNPAAFSRSVTFNESS